jgi:hypothetical protein
MFEFGGVKWRLINCRGAQLKEQRKNLKGNPVE